MPANAAIFFESYAFHTRGKKLMGAQSASEGFLRAFARYSGVETFYCLTQSKDESVRFQKLVHNWAPAVRPVEWIRFDNLPGLERPGCLYHPQPALAERAWQRRLHDERAYSLCGVTHTTCSAAAMDVFGTYLIAPFQPWDAVICTSKSVRATLDRVLGHWAEYLAERIGARPQVRLQLPIIPLGVDCAAFDRVGGDPSLRPSLRAKLGIGPEDVAFLFMGRLSFHAKAHPLPMYLALEEAARRTGKHLHLIQAGWFPNDSVQREFINGARRFCPSVNSIILDGRLPEVRERIWFAADIFTSLADNIQETFGLVPIEAMAAGLPPVISDWDGYRDTVRDGVDGLRVPTIMPPGGTAGDIAWRHAFEVDTYDRYVAHCSQCTAVDWRACAEAYIALIENPPLRRKLGESGRQRARESFDWAVIIRRYQELWRELGERRAQATVGRRADIPPNPLREDPYALFAEYATHLLTAQTVLSAARGSSRALLEEFYQNPLVNYVGAPFLLASLDECRSALDRLKHSPRPVSELLEPVEPARRFILHRTLGWMLKCGLVEIIADR